MLYDETFKSNGGLLDSNSTSSETWNPKQVYARADTLRIRAKTVIDTAERRLRFRWWFHPRGYFWENTRSNRRLWTTNDWHWSFLYQPSAIFSVGYTPVSHSMQTAVFEDHRLVCTDLASFISQLFINTIRSPWHFKTLVLFNLHIFYITVGFCKSLVRANCNVKNVQVE
jgi:hypothetical protein